MEISRDTFTTSIVTITQGKQKALGGVDFRLRWNEIVGHLEDKGVTR